MRINLKEFHSQRSLMTPDKSAHELTKRAQFMDKFYRSNKQFYRTTVTALRVLLVGGAAAHAFYVN